VQSTGAVDGAIDRSSAAHVGESNPPRLSGERRVLATAATTRNG